MSFDMIGWYIRHGTFNIWMLMSHLYDLFVHLHYFFFQIFRFQMLLSHVIYTKGKMAVVIRFQVSYSQVSYNFSFSCFKASITNRPWECPRPLQTRRPKPKDTWTQASNQRTQEHPRRPSGTTSRASPTRGILPKCRRHTLPRALRTMPTFGPIPSDSTLRGKVTWAPSGRSRVVPPVSRRGWVRFSFVFFRPLACVRVGERDS